MLKRIFCTSLLIAGPLAGSIYAETNAELKEQVRKTEIAFAKTMADRNPTAFVTFLSKEAIFLSGGGHAARGPEQIIAAWKALFDAPKAPFSWEPEFVEVLGSGTLALSTGPVRDPEGKRVGTFNSTWRRERKGQWKIVLDNGCPK